MFRTRFFSLWITALAVAFSPAHVAAQPPCPAGQVLGFTVTAAGGAMTIQPDGLGQTFAGQGTPITVCLTCNGAPLGGLPASAVTVSAPGLVFCGPGGHDADGPTNAVGCTTFTKSLCGGGCSPFLDVFAAGTYLATVPIFVKSPDTGVSSPGFVDAADVANFASVFGSIALFDPCYDFNHTGGPTIDAADLAYFASVLGSACGAVCP